MTYCEPFVCRKHIAQKIGFFFLGGGITILVQTIITHIQGYFAAGSIHFNGFAISQLLTYDVGDEGLRASR